MLPLTLAPTSVIGDATRNEPASYRLAGVMLVGNTRIGILEVPSGGQVLVRIGTVVDGGKVSVFNDSEMRIVLPDRTVVLQLAAGAGETSSNAAIGVVVDSTDDGHIMVRQVDPDRMIAAIDRSRPTTGTTTGKPERPDAASDLGRRVAAIAHLPVNARVIAINDQPVVSTDRAIAEIDRALSMGQGMTLNLESLSGEPPGRVYLIPQRD